MSNCAFQAENMRVSDIINYLAILIDAIFDNA